MYDFNSMDKRLLVFGFIFRVANRMQTQMDIRMKELTAKQWFVLLMIGMFEESPTLKELAQMSDSSHQNTKQIVLKLQEKGFVKITSDVKDARAMRIVLTNKSREWNEANSDMASRFIDDMFSNLSHGEVTNLSNSLLELHKTLGEMDLKEAGAL